MTGDFWLIRNPGEIPDRMEHFARYLEERNEWPICWQAKKYTSPRSLDQNALMWLWVTEFAKFLLDKAKVSEDEKEDMAYTLQRRCYADTGYEWLLDHNTDLLTGETKPVRRSTTKFQKGEMTVFLEWIQCFAANRGLILESMGEYAELQASQVA